MLSGACLYDFAAGRCGVRVNEQFYPSVRAGKEKSRFQRDFAALLFDILARVYYNKR